MQTTILDPSLTQTLAAAREPGLTLIIGNKNYSCLLYTSTLPTKRIV